MPSDFTSSSNELFIKIHSDYIETRAGFLISYEAVIRHCSLAQCKEGEGDCSLDSECEGLLVCGHMNCANSTLTNCCTKPCNNDADCSNQECHTEINQCRLDSYSTDWSFCSLETPCADGEGDCDDHLECEGSLVCGNNNCPNGTSWLDCCEQKKSNSLPSVNFPEHRTTRLGPN